MVVGCTQPKPFNNGRLKVIHLQPVKSSGLVVSVNTNNALLVGVLTTYNLQPTT